MLRDSVPVAVSLIKTTEKYCPVQLLCHQDSIMTLTVTGLIKINKTTGK